MKKKKIRIVQTKKPKRRPCLAEQPYSLEKDGVTQSTLVSYESCRRRCRNTLDGWRAIGESESAIFGGLFHGLLEHFYKAIIAKEVVKGDQRDFFEMWIKKWIKKNLKMILTSGSTIQFLAAQAEPVFLAYCDYWPEDFARKQWVELEGVFDTMWNGFRLRGMRDGFQFVKCDRKKGRMLETKTKIQIPTHLDLTLRYNTQNLFYLTAINNDGSKLGIKKFVEKVLYNIVRRPGLKYDGGSLKKYKKKIADHINAGKGPDHYFKRMELRYPKKDQVLFQKELLGRLNEFKAWLAGHPLLQTYKKDSSCTASFWCRFIDSCATKNMDACTRTGRLFVELEG